MAADGSDVQQLTNEPGRDYEPDASPDGKRIVFASQRATGDSSQLYLMDVDGSNVRRLTFSADTAANRVLDDYAEWSRDGTRIAFQRTIIPEEGKASADIWLIDLETQVETASDRYAGRLGQHADLHGRRQRRHLREQPQRFLRAVPPATRRRRSGPPHGERRQRSGGERIAGR